MDNFMRKVLDTAAAFCLLFDVDWDSDFEDDDYVLERRAAEAEKKRIRVIGTAPGFAAK